MDKKIAEQIAAAQAAVTAKGNAAQPEVISVDLDPARFEEVAETILATVPGLIVHTKAITGSGVNPDGTPLCPMAFKNNGGATKLAQFWSTGKLVLTNITPETLGL